MRTLIDIFFGSANIFSIGFEENVNNVMEKFPMTNAIDKNCTDEGLIGNLEGEEDGDSIAVSLISQYRIRLKIFI